MIGNRFAIAAPAFLFAMGLSAAFALDNLRRLGGDPRFKTAEIVWTMSHLDGVNIGLVERYRTQVTGDSILQSNFGDENGFHEYSFKAAPMKPVSALSAEEVRELAWPRERIAGTHNTLEHDGQVWSLPQVERPVAGRAGPAGHPSLPRPADFSKIGLSPSWSTSAAHPFHLEHHLYQGFETAVFSEGFQDGYRTVTAVYSDAEYGEKRLTWSYDDRRGGQPVRAMLEFHAQFFMSETDLKLVDGRWFPVTVRFYTQESPAPYKILEVSKATFDEEWHKQELSSADLGALFGTQFTITDGTGFRFWDGTDLISDDDFWEFVYGFGAMFDDKILKARAESMGISTEEFRKYYTEGRHAEWARNHYRQKHVGAHGEEPPWITLKNSKEKDPWDLYVDEFLKKHELLEPGVERAKKFLEEAKKLRDANRHRIRKAERERDRKTIERYKEREERIYRERLVDPLDQLAATIAKENRDRQDNAQE